MQQKIFSFDWHAHKTKENFVIDQSNQDAFRRVTQINSWPEKALLITGAKHTGKSHLAEIFSQEHCAQHVTLSDDVGRVLQGNNRIIVIDDVDEKILQHHLTQEDIFHLYNAVIKHSSGRLLLTASIPVPSWAVLPDLSSRLAIAEKIHLGTPGDETLGAAFAKLFADRGLAVDGKLIRFLVLRTERSIAAVYDRVEQLDAESLRLGQKLTIPFVTKILDNT